MAHDDRRIFPHQLIFFMFVVNVALGLIRTPRVLALTMGHDGWLAIYLAFPLAALGAAAAVAVCGRHPEATLLPLLQACLGRLPGFLVCAALSMYYCFVGMLHLRYMVQLVNQWLFPSFPEVAMTLILVLPSLYILFLPFKVHVGFCQMLFVMGLIVAAFVVIMYNLIDWRLIQPLFVSGLTKTVAALPRALALYAGLALVLPAYPRFSQGSKPFRWLMASKAFTAWYAAMGAMITIALLGDSETATRLYPLITITKVAPAVIIDRLDVLFIALWLPSIGLAMTAFIREAVNGVRALVPKVPRPAVNLAVIAVVTAAASVITDVNMTERLLGHLGYGLLATGIALPCAMLTADTIRRRLAR